MVGRTPRKKGVRRTHKQRGGAGTNGKSNYTLFFTGWGFNPVDYPGSGSSFKPGPPGNAFFPWGTDIICDTQNNLYVSSWYIGMILKIDTKGNMTKIADTFHASKLGWLTNGSWPMIVTGFGSEPIVLISSTGVVTKTTYMDRYGNSNGPSSICGDSVGNIYYIDANSQCIWRIDTGGNYSVFAGSQNQGGDVDGALTTARFSSPGNTTNALRYDPRTNAMYMYDVGNFKYKKISLSTNTVTTLATANPKGRIGYLAVHPNADSTYR